MAVVRTSPRARASMAGATARGLAAAAIVAAAAVAVLIAMASGPRVRTFEAQPATAARATGEPRPGARRVRGTALPVNTGDGQAAVWQIPERRLEPPASRPLSQKELLAKAGEKDGDTTYTRLLEEVLDQLPALDDGTRDELRTIARKRMSALKSKLIEQPGLGDQRGPPDEDQLTPMERRLLGEERYRLYRAKMAETFQQ